MIMSIILFLPAIMEVPPQCFDTATVTPVNWLNKIFCIFQTVPDAFGHENLNLTSDNFR